MCKISHFKTAHYHSAIAKLQYRVQKQRITENLYPSGYPPRPAHHMRIVYNKSRGNITSQTLYILDNLLLCGMILRHIGGIQNRQTHTAGQMSRINDSHIFKRLCSQNCVMIPVAGMFCHGNMNHILSLGQLLGKKALVVFHFRRLGITIMSFIHMYQQLIRLNFLVIQKTSLIRTDIIGTYGDTKLFLK